MKVSSPLFLLALVSIIFVACKKEDGPAGKNSLVNQVTEPAGANCAVGGIKITSGLDANGNNVLDSNEIQKTDYVCNVTSIYNKETIITFPIAGIELSTTLATGEMNDLGAIHNFNIANYPADSISFNAIVGTNDPTLTAFVDLYDQTNNKVIANATLSKAGSSELKTTTVNFLKDLPKGPVTLNCRVRASSPNPNYNVAYVHFAELRIYKK